MTNIYFLWVGGTPPSPWQIDATYDGRYLRTTVTVAQAKVTGGSATHSHSISGFVCGYCGNAGDRRSLTNSVYMVNHNCHPLGTNSVVPENNDPLYYTFKLIYMDLATWEASERSVPRDALFLSENAISNWNEVTRYTASDGKLIKLGTAGTSGGRSTHGHTVNIALGNCDAYANSHNSPPTDAWISGIAHSHSSTASIAPSTNHLPPRIQTRIYKASQTTTKAQAGIIAFVDDSASSYWDTVDWVDRFIECANVDATAVGVSSHNHTGGSGTSAAFARSSVVYTYAGDVGANPIPSTVTSHTHPYSYDLDSSGHEPEYVNLVPVRLNTTLYHINSYDVAFIEDVLLCKALDEEITSSVRMKGAGTEIITPDILLRKTVDLSTPLDTMLAKRLTETFDLDAIVKVENRKAWLTSLRLIITTKAIGASLRIIQPHQTTYPVLDAILKAWTTQLDEIQMRASMMDLSNKLDYATDSEIDLKWGAIYNLPRFVDEPDEHYRKRIKTYTMIQTGSGTRPVCEAALDEIVDEPGASRVETREPGKVRVYWNSNTAPHVAAERMNVINATVPMMLAAGISWEMFLEYIELSVNLKLQGVDYVESYLDLLMQSPNRTVEYYIRPRLMARDTIAIPADAILKAAFLKTLLTNSQVKVGKVLGLEADGLFLKHCDLELPADFVQRATVPRIYLMGQGLQKFDISEEVIADALVKRAWRRSVHVMLAVVSQLVSEALFDLEIQRFDNIRLFPVDILAERQFQNNAAMNILLVAA